jgi:hypothetical protein
LTIKSEIVTKDDLRRRFFPDAYRALEIKHAAEKARAAEVARLEVQRGQPQPITNRRKAKVWKGTVTAFALKVKAEWERSNKIKAKTLNAALEQACKLYIRPGGRPFSVKSLYMLLSKHQDKMDGKV